MRSTTRLIAALATAGAVAAGLLWGCDGHAAPRIWPSSAGNLAGTRAAVGSLITARNVARLGVRWRFLFSAKPSYSSTFASTPVADADTVYVQDLRSNVFALDRSTGGVLWSHPFRGQKGGPNGLAVDAGRVYGETDSDAFALAASNGRELWRRRLTSARGLFAGVAPVAWKGFLFMSTMGGEPPRHGTLYALDAATGVVRWKFATIEQPRTHSIETTGPVSIDAAGRLYAGSSFALDARSGRLLPSDQAIRADAGGDALGTTPVLATNDGTDVVFGAGKTGRVTAWNRQTNRQLWKVEIGQRVCVSTPMAYADERLFVPVVDRCDDPASKGRLVALDAGTGRTVWERRLPSPDVGCATVSNDLVFTSTYDGTLYAFAARDGRLLWHTRLRAELSGCPAVAGATLLVGAELRRPGGPRPALVAFTLR